MRTLIKSAAVIGLLATSAMVLAQGRGGRGGPPPEPSLMTYAMAAKAMAAAEAHAKENGWLMSIRIVDQNDNVVMIHRMQDARPGTVDVTGMKTHTVIESKMTSAEYGAKVQAGDIDEIEGAVTFGGGVPAYVDGKLVGAIAASGAAPGQDEEVAKAGVAAIGGSTMMPH
jgi:uncharacterized protein GlcG (DUF336 family)